MADLKKMSIEELEAYRDSQSKAENEAHAQFRAAGLELSKKRAATPEAMAKAKIAEGRAELLEATVGSEAEGMEVVNDG